jgi:hypothetical protein
MKYAKVRKANWETRIDETLKRTVKRGRRAKSAAGVGRSSQRQPGCQQTQFLQGKSTENPLVVVQTWLQ